MQRDLIEYVSATSDPTLRAAWQTWREASAAVAQSWLRSDADETQLRALRDRAENAERRFWNRAGNGPQDAVPSTDALAAALPDDAVLVAIAEGIAPDPAWPLIADGRDGWVWTLDGLAGDPDSLLEPLHALGATVGEMHTALASDPTDPVFAPEERGHESLALYVASLDEQIERAVGGFSALAVTPVGAVR